MRRRDFVMLLGGATVSTPMLWPLAARAQQSDPIRRVGVLIGFAEDDPETKARLAGFRQGLERRKWSEGHNVHLDYRFAAGNFDQFRVLAKELITLQPDVILAHTTAVAAALQRESRTIPIVFVNVSDPIGAGFIESMAQPGGNFTGVLHYEAGIIGKWLAMLKEIAPRLERAALIADPKTTAYDYFLRAAEAAAPSLGIEVVPRPIENAAADITRAIDPFARLPNGGLLVPPGVTALAHRNLIIALAARHRLPAVYPFRVYVEAGGLMSYATDQVDMFRLAASYVDRILRGDKPANLPVQAPTKFETTLNLRTAKELGFDVPPSLLVRADEVIE
jgi:putative ABC transport system substrate-binding protein